MRARRLKAVARKEFIHVIRDPRSLALSIAIPMILIFLFGFALTLDVDNVPTIIWDQSRSAASREFLSRFFASRYFSPVAQGENYRDLERAIDERIALAALIVPGDFAARVARGDAVSVQMIFDGSDPNTATIALGYADTVAGGFSREIAVSSMRRQSPAAPSTPVDFRPRVWFNAELESRNYIIPGLIAIIMMVIAALLTSLTIAGEWERGTMEQLISTPVTEPELILGKLAPYFVIGMVDVVISVLMGEFLFAVPLRGSVALLFIMAAVFLVGALSMGITVSVVTKSQLLSSQAAMVLTFIPAFLLSGLVFPISNMPRAVQMVTYLVPARYFVSLLKDIYMKGLGLKALGLEAVLLAVFSAAMLSTAVLKFKKKLD